MDKFPLTDYELKQLRDRVDQLELFFDYFFLEEEFMKCSHPAARWRELRQKRNTGGTQSGSEAAES